MDYNSDGDFALLGAFSRFRNTTFVIYYRHCKLIIYVDFQALFFQFEDLCSDFFRLTAHRNDFYKDNVCGSFDALKYNKYLNPTVTD